MGNENKKIIARKILAAIWMFFSTSFAIILLAYLLSQLFAPILHEGAIAFFYFGPLLSIIGGMYMAVYGWKGDISVRSYISLGILIVAFVFCFFIVSFLSKFLSTPSSPSTIGFLQIILIVGAISCISYPVLQYYALRRFRGPWHHLALLPFLLVIISIYTAIFRYKYWLSLLFISAPIASLHLAIALAAQKIRKTKQTPD